MLAPVVYVDTSDAVIQVTNAQEQGTLIEVDPLREWLIKTARVGKRREKVDPVLWRCKENGIHTIAGPFVFVVCNIALYLTHLLSRSHGSARNGAGRSLV